MARQSGSANFAGTIEVQAGGPLDARTVVPAVADLTASGTFPYSYEGMVVAVKANHKLYQLIGSDPTVSASWLEVGGDHIPNSEKGTAGGVAELDNTGKVPSSQLPSFVDDVVDGYYKEADGKFYEESTYTTEIVGETGKIYISVDTDIQYRWTGSAYSALGGALVLGETSSTAYRGDRGKTAYDHSQQMSGNPHNVTKTDVGLGNVDNTADIDKPISTSQQTALNAKQDILQFDTMPTASVDNVGAIIQYVGTTTGTYTNGYFYECTEDNGTYSWVAKNVQAGGSSGGGHTILDPEDTEMTQRANLKFSGDISVTDDSTDEETVVAPHRLTSSELSEIMSTLPSPVNRGVVYDDTERAIGTWFGKPLYQKVLTGTLNTMIDVSTLSIDEMVYINAITILANGNYSVVPNVAVSELFYSSTQNGIRSDTTNTYYKDRPYTCIIEYTKTTDTI